MADGEMGVLPVPAVQSDRHGMCVHGKCNTNTNCICHIIANNHVNMYVYVLCCMICLLQISRSTRCNVIVWPSAHSFHMRVVQAMTPTKRLENIDMSMDSMDPNQHPLISLLQGMYKSKHPRTL